MNKREITMIAKEVVTLLNTSLKDEFLKQIQNNIREETESFIGVSEAADYLGCSVSYIKKHLDEIPHTKVGRRNKFLRSKLFQYAKRKGMA